MKKLPRLLLVALLLISFASTGLADDKRKKKKKDEREHYETVIASATATAVTINENKLTRTIPITPTTEIWVRGTKADFSALQPGMAVSVTLAMDGVNASRVTASDPPVHREFKKVKPVRSLMK